MFGGADGNHAFGLGSEELGAVDRDGGRVNLVAGHTFDFAKHAVDGVGGAGEVGQDAFAHTGVFSFVVANDGNLAIFGDGSDDGAYVFCSNV